MNWTYQDEVAYWMHTYGFNQWQSELAADETWFKYRTLVTG
jgi:hypothetical protein